ncbi:unnamed protein product [Ectocarpus sp. CCAP 1310/34]|nr:unnamed protein product [Ectocarpus sp. CCAP 1310/34]
MTRGFLGSCGRAVHGKEAPGGGLGLCFACGRPGSRDGCSSRWKHVGQTTYWAEVGEWSAMVGQEWPHERDLQGDPLKVGECICTRPDCAGGIVQKVQEALREGRKRV